MAVLPSIHTTDDDYETLEMMASPDNDTRPPLRAANHNRHGWAVLRGRAPVVRATGNG
ncbi:MAG: hypothetical protein ABIQ53_03280 [Terracoccus sp.]